MVTIGKYILCCGWSWIGVFQFAIVLSVSIAISIVIPYDDGVQFGNNIVIGVYTSHLVHYRIGYNQ